MRLRAMAVAVACLLGAASVGLAACDPVPKRVLVIGDSLTVGTMLAHLGASHPWNWTISAEGGRSTNAGIAVAQERDVAKFDLVIIALGTNDILDSKATYGARIDNMMKALAKAKKVIWINVDSGAERLRPASLGVNPAIAAAPARHPKLTVGDWDGAVRWVPDMAPYRAADGIHYTLAGYDMRARWMERLVPA